MLIHFVATEEIYHSGTIPVRWIKTDLQKFQDKHLEQLFIVKNIPKS